MRRSRRTGDWAWAVGLVPVLVLAVAGCGTSGSGPSAEGAAPAFPGVKVVVAAVGDPAVVKAVAAQRGEWQASRGATCEVRERPVEPSDLRGAHVLVFRGDRLGDLVDVKALAVLPESVVRPPARAESEPGPGADGGERSAAEADPLQFSDVLPPYRDQVAKYGPDRMALPIGGSALVLAYNRAAFDRPANRQAAEKAGLTLGPPETWAQLDALAKFFQGRDWSGDGNADHGIALALGPDPEGVADAVYLARAAALGQHRDHYSLLFDSDSMQPRLTAPPFVEALEGLAALKAFGPPGAEAFDAPSARAAFRKGDVALLIDRAERASEWGGQAKAVGVAPLPGSERVFEPMRRTWDRARPPNRPAYLPYGGGWLVGVAASASGRERDAAVDFARYLVNPETSSRVRSDRDVPMLPVRGSQVSQGVPDPRQAPGVEPRPWIEAVNQTLGAERVVPGLRIPKADAYLADLASARAAAVAGEPAEKALARAAEAWSKRTDALGRDRQLWHYRRSLNALVTDPNPPAPNRPH